ncbi:MULTISPECIES: TetR/AcrR family transcriptional regulator [Bacillus cereus group]|uniref:TetR/AcrR family transcriptional regulator n=1 Tax=Bacillus cereus TaxID=1396 RepID=A0AA44Q5J4_BACCE|nr:MULTISPECIES: TetR/AcrR family transcriptional regulator [Bacillus cereus group]PFA22764.1 TetR/AcrR family transcriptional regulator [Bacillus cereus]PFN05117.1 TetR/AcrR family transcriptional regulator [Bacillus cereus]PFO79772.1 TetR/AcrR family transcriptional regulator [Bacillus cereus]PFR88139.1 TetR/AcrR family transcriptional regulator [Bacillus cereus]PGZ14092.1 TetR/AcrR family transcriptional regulator [Bacillus cereus]
MEKSLLSTRQQRSIETRNKLLKSAYNIFLENGFHKTTISQIIKHAETGYGTAYVYFKNKDDLLIVLMEDTMNRFYKIAERSFLPKTKKEAHNMIRNQTRSFLQVTEEERNILQVVEEAIGASKEVRKKWNEIQERFINRIMQDITYSQENGLARNELNKEIVARGWFSMNEMFLWEIVRNEKEVNLEEIVYTLTEMYTAGLYKNR